MQRNIFKTFSKTKAVSAFYFAKCNSTKVTGCGPGTTVREISIKQKNSKVCTNVPPTAEIHLSENLFCKMARLPVAFYAPINVMLAGAGGGGGGRA